MKHFAVHSGPEPKRHTFDAVVSERDLRESYLPHFETTIKETKPYTLMCAYNRIDARLPTAAIGSSGSSGACGSFPAAPSPTVAPSPTAT
ncbi:MAG: hypothetical protein ABI601_12355 [bacterium]